VTGSAKKQHIDEMCKQYREFVDKTVKSFNHQNDVDQLCKQHRKLLNKTVVLFNKCEPAKLSEDNIEKLRVHCESLKNEIVELFQKQKNENLTINDIFNQLREQHCAPLKNEIVNLLKRQDDVTLSEENKKYIDYLCHLYFNSFEEIALHFNKENLNDLFVENIDKLYEQHGRSFCNAFAFLNQQKLDTWVVKNDVNGNAKITMTDKAFNEKLGGAFKKAQAEKSEDENQKLEGKLEEYRNQLLYQLEQLKKEIKDDSQLRDIKNIEKRLKEIKKANFTLNKNEKKLLSSLQESKDPKIKQTSNLVLYIQELCDIKQREIDRLNKQADSGSMRVIGRFIEKYIIQDVSNASFVFWIGFFLALCLAVPVATALSIPVSIVGPILVAIAAGTASLYLIATWTTRLVNYFRDRNSCKKSNEEIKEELIRRQWLSVEQPSLTLDQEIAKLNQLLELKSERAQLLERKETWLYVDVFLDGFVRGSFAPFFILWFSTTVLAFFSFGLVSISPFVSAILTTVVLVLAISYGIYKAYNYYKATQCDIDRLREKFHNEKVEQYDQVVDKFYNDLQEQCKIILHNDKSDLLDKLNKEIAQQRDELKKKVYNFLGSEQDKQLLLEQYNQSYLDILDKAEASEKEKKELSNLFTDQFNKLKAINLNPDPQPKESKDSFWLTAKLTFIFLTAVGSGILFLKLLVMGVVLAWSPAAFLGIAVVGLLVVGGLLYGAWDVWKNYRLIDEQSKEETPVLFPWTDTVSLGHETKSEVAFEKQNPDETFGITISKIYPELPELGLEKIHSEEPSKLDQIMVREEDENCNHLSVNAMISGGFLSNSKGNVHVSATDEKQAGQDIQVSVVNISCLKLM
jgi:hypothetical protein